VHRLLFDTPFSDLTRRISLEYFRSRWRTIACFSVKRQIFLYPCFVGSIEDRGFGEVTLPLCTFGRQQVSTTRLATQDFAGRGYLKAFCHRFFRFASRYRFWHREPGTYTLESGTQQETTHNVSKASRLSLPESLVQIGVWRNTSEGPRRGKRETKAACGRFNARRGSVPEGRSDRSLARSAWNSPTPKRTVP
jgi:hypothetical protein